MHIENAAYAFELNGEPVSCVPYGHGHINQTLKIDTDTGEQYILQRINKHVFKDPIRLMDNISAVTEYLRGRIADPRMALHFIRTHDGKYYHVDEDGQYWRMYHFVEGFSLDTPESKDDFYQSALAFGRFQSLLAQFPADTLTEIIPEFHNTIDRYRQFKEVLAKDPCGRLAGVRAEVDFLLEREELAGTLQRMRESGELPLRVTHKDTKLNNVLLDSQSRKSLCVLDLDTVMPGLSLYDFGDSIRFGAATAAEDEKDLDKMTMDLELFRVYTKGYMEACPTLTDKEVEMLPMGALLMTLECGLRFLTDYIDGDHYFRIAYPAHNLDRARTQLKLVADMQSKWEVMNRIVAETASQVRG